MPELMALQKKEKEKFNAGIYIGKKAFRTLVEEMLGAKKCFAIGWTGQAFGILKYELAHIIRRRIKKVHLKIIAHEKARKKFSKYISQTKHIQIKHLSKGYYTPAGITIWNNKVSISLLEDKPIFVVIESRKVYNSYKKYFNLLWKLAKK